MSCSCLKFLSNIFDKDQNLKVHTQPNESPESKQSVTLSVDKKKLKSNENQINLSKSNNKNGNDRYDQNQIEPQLLFKKNENTPTTNEGINELSSSKKKKSNEQNYDNEHNYSELFELDNILQESNVENYYNSQSDDDEVENSKNQSKNYDILNESHNKPKLINLDNLNDSDIKKEIGSHIVKLSDSIMRNTSTNYFNKTNNKQSTCDFRLAHSTSSSANSEDEMQRKMNEMAYDNYFKQNRKISESMSIDDGIHLQSGEHGVGQLNRHDSDHEVIPHPKLREIEGIDSDHSIQHYENVNGLENFESNFRSTNHQWNFVLDSHV